MENDHSGKNVFICAILFTSVLVEKVIILLRAIALKSVSGTMPFGS